MQNEIQVKQGLDAQEVISIILRHKWAVLLVFLAFTLTISYYSLSKPTLYRSSAILYFEDKNNNPILDLLGKNNNSGGGMQTLDAGYFEIIITTDLFDKRFRQELKEQLKKYRDEDYVRMAIKETSAKQIALKPYKEAAQFIEIASMSYDSFLVQKMIEVAADLLKKRTAELDQEGLQNGIQFIVEQIQLTQTNLEKTEIELEALKKKTDIISKDAEGPLTKVILMKDKLGELETQIQIKSSNLFALETQMDSIQRRMTGSNQIKPDKESKEELRIKSQIDDLKNKKASLFEKLGADAFENSEVKKIDQQMSDLRNQYYALLSSVTLGSDKVISSDLNEVWKSVFTKKNEEEIELLILKGQARLYSGLIRNFELKNPNLLQDAIDMTQLTRSKQVYEGTLNSLIQQKENFSIQFYGTTGNLKLVDPAKAPVAIYNKVFTNIFIGSLVGLLMGIALSFGLEFFDNSIKSVEGITALTNIPIIGKIPPIDVGEISGIANVGEHITEKLKFRKKRTGEPEDKNVVRKKAMISRFNARSFVSERYRTLRTNIQFTNIDTPMRSVLVSSAGPGEGKTTTAVNLGISFSDMGHNVCLVDTDFRKPKHHLLFEISESPGLTDIVINNMDLDAAIQPTSIKNLSVLTVGSNAYNHSEIFSSMRMSILMNELEKRFEMVIYDTPPILLLTDSVILSSRVDGVLMVVKYAVTQKPFLLNAITALKAVRANIIGIVLNDFAGEHRNYYQYAYDSYYLHPSEKKEKV